MYSSSTFDGHLIFQFSIALPQIKIRSPKKQLPPHNRRPVNAHRSPHRPRIQVRYRADQPEQRYDRETAHQYRLYVFAGGGGRRCATERAEQQRDAALAIKHSSKEISAETLATTPNGFATVLFSSTAAFFPPAR